MAIQIGMNGRFFPGNWRPALEEIAFAQRSGFEALQFRGATEGLGEGHVGTSLEEVAEALAEANLAATMELLIRLDKSGKTPEGLTPFGILETNLLAITSLPCTHVHWHLVPTERISETQARDLEAQLVPQFGRAVHFAQEHGFRFGLEHNERALKLFAPPERCAWILRETEGLGLVWDFNHTAPEDLAAFKALGERVMGLHVSDTPLPEVNYHLPLGLGNLDYTDYCASLFEHGFSGPAILEIGGLPKSGGYGRDTDEALIDSARRLREALVPARDSTS